MIVFITLCDKVIMVCTLKSLKLLLLYEELFNSKSLLKIIRTDVVSIFAKLEINNK